MGKPTGREMAMQILVSWTLGIAASKPKPEGRGEELAPLHQVLTQKLYDMTEEAGFDSASKQVALAEGIQALDAAFVLAARVREIEDSWDESENS